jgi:uncharacterized protein YceK
MDGGCGSVRSGTDSAKGEVSVWCCVTFGHLKHQFGVCIYATVDANID